MVRGLLQDRDRIVPNADALILDEVFLCSSVGVPAGQRLQAPPRLYLHNLQISRYAMYAPVYTL